MNYCTLFYVHCFLRFSISHLIAIERKIQHFDIHVHFSKEICRVYEEKKKSHRLLISKCSTYYNNQIIKLSLLHKILAMATVVVMTTPINNNYENNNNKLIYTHAQNHHKKCFNGKYSFSEISTNPKLSQSLDKATTVTHIYL